MKFDQVGNIGAGLRAALNQSPASSCTGPGHMGGPARIAGPVEAWTDGMR